MYVEQPQRVTDDQLARMRKLATRVDTKPGPGGSRITQISTHTTWWVEASASFSGLPGWPSWQSVSVVALYPSSQLVAHCDPPINATRYHVPLVVNPGCWVFHDGTWQQLEVGRVYQMDPERRHGAVNWGTEVRLHLIVDVS